MRDFTDITMILDRSGSMSSVQDATIKGFNDFVEDQRKTPGDGCWTLVQFDDQYEVVFAQVPQTSMGLLTPDKFAPRGSTALVDAVCRTIDQAGQRLGAMPTDQRPSRVLMVIMTDGFENASREYTTRQMADKIAHQREKYGWVFLFLAANQDAIATAAKYNIPAGNASNYQPTSAGIMKGMGLVSRGTRNWKADGNNTAEQLLSSAEPDVQVNVNVVNK